MDEGAPYRSEGAAALAWSRALDRASRLVARADHAARAGFQIATPELAGINRWLVRKSVLTCFYILAFVTLLELAGGPPLPLHVIFALCAVAIAASIPFRAWLDGGAALGLLVYAQFVLDVVLLTIGFSQLEMLPVLFHLQFLLVVIPCSLLSRQCGTIMTALVVTAHLFLCWLRGSHSVAEVLGPVYIFTIVAHQCFFYGARLAEKTQLAEHESRVVSSLLAAADELAAERSSTALLQRLTRVAKDVTGGDWAGVTLADEHDGGQRVGALVTRRGFIDDEVLSVGLPPSARLDARIAEAGARCIVVTSAEDSLLPAELHERWRIGGYLVAVLRRGSEPLGLLFVGCDDPGKLTSGVSQRLVAGLARLGALALDNARLVEDVLHASALKSEFIGTVSHELRSPLHAILGYNEILRDEAAAAPESESAARREILDRVHVHAHQLHEMIEATLSVSRLESGRVPLRVETFAVQQMLDEIAAEVPEFRRSAAVELRWRVPERLPAIEGDRGKLKTIVRNLVDNALKFTDAGSVTVIVSLVPEDEQAVADGEPASLHLVVADTGIGIASEQHASVFEMFRQGDGSLTRRHAGVGLGLYIVKRLVEALRGRIALDSTPGVGTSFTLGVPVTVRAARSAPPEAPDDGPASAAQRI